MAKLLLQGMSLSAFGYAAYLTAHWMSIATAVVEHAGR